MVFKIPPISKRSTASNITFDKGGEFKVQEQCNNTKKQSSAFHGVKSRPQLSVPPSNAVVQNAKILTPLISPTTEKELLKDIMWIGSAPSSSTTDSINSSPNQRDEDNTTIFSPTWEENYQDLSGWCSRIPMDHSSYSFPVGESLNRGHSGMKIDDKTYSTNVGVVIDVGVTSASTVAFDEFKQQSYNNNNNNNNNDSNNINNNINNHNNNNINNNQIVTILPPIDDEKPEIIGGSIDVPDEWLDLPKSSIALRTDEWIRLVDNEKVDEPLQRIEIDGINDNVNFDNSSPVEPTVNWDIISTFDNNEKDNFDLLSYLCDDNIRSPESISTDSVDIYQASTSYNPQNNDKILRLHNTRKSRRSYKSETPSLTKNSSDLHDVKPSKSLLKSLVAPPSPSASSSSGDRLKTARTKTRTAKTIKTRMKKEEISSDDIKRGRKRQYDSDSDDASSDFSYRESREKNNEASRKSRMNKKAKEREMMSKAVGLEKNNRVLKAKVEQLEKMVITMRNAILQSALRRNV